MVDESELIHLQAQDAAARCRQKLRKAQADHSKAMREPTKWEHLILDLTKGTGVFLPEQIKRRMDTVQETVAGFPEQIDMLREQTVETAFMAKEIQDSSHQRLLSWIDLFVPATIEGKKMIVPYTIKAVTPTRDYRIEVEFAYPRCSIWRKWRMG